MSFRVIDIQKCKKNLLAIFFWTGVSEVIGNNWLVSNAVFSGTALRIFLVFCMKLGDYKGRKVTQLGFWKKSSIWRYSRKRHFDIFLKNDSSDFFGFSPEVSTKYGLQFFWTCFSEKFIIWRYLTSKSSKNCPNLGFCPFFSTLHN